MSSTEYIADSIKGTQREENKDRTLVLSSEHYLLAVLFDGISSAPDANRGIDVAVNFIQKKYTEFVLDKSYNLTDLMWKAHCAITQSGLGSPYSTFSAICIAHDKSWAVFSSLGDSRVYEVTPQYIKQLTKDDNPPHSKNVVTRYLGMLKLERTDFLATDLNMQEKRVLLCSDGFYSLLEENRRKFHPALNFDRAGNIKNNLSNEISGKNFDDASYIFVL
jgi:serine/threonine protein phosphatase PrpC